MPQLRLPKQLMQTRTEEMILDSCQVISCFWIPGILGEGSKQKDALPSFTLDSLVPLKSLKPAMILQITSLNSLMNFLPYTLFSMPSYSGNMFLMTLSCSLIVYYQGHPRSLP